MRFAFHMRQARSRDAGPAPYGAAMSSHANSSYQQDATELVARTARAARSAQRSVAAARRELKDAGLHAMADGLLEATEEILAANRDDVERARAEGMTEGLIDRLSLTPDRIAAIAVSLREIAGLPDPIGEVVDALTLKSGNAVVLRGGSAAAHTNSAIVNVLRAALVSTGLPADLVATIDSAGRAGAAALMQARGLIDVLVPRGGAGLIKAVVEQSAVPVIETGSGNCHIYADSCVDLEAAVPLIVNAKTQRVGVCNAAETLLVHHDVADRLLPTVAAALWDEGVTLHADEAAETALRGPATRAGCEALLVPATEEDWATEYGSLDLALRVVSDLEEAVAHISQWSTGHTEAILTQDIAAMNRFTGAVDSAVVMVNASTRFTDGGQLGLGAELGISTQKLHARGPMGLAALTTTQWIVEGDGHVRP